MNPDLDLLVLGAHPDDAEVHVGGLLALTARAGLRAAILDLTSGDLGTRGTAATRRTEAMAAAELLGVQRIILDLPDARFDESETNRLAIMAQLRRLRPGILILPAPEDRHPDHRRAFRLAREAAYYAGLRNYPCPGEPWRPRAAAAPTRISDPAFRRGVEGRAMHWGSLILANWAEALWTERPIPHELLAFLARIQRPEPRG